MEYSRKKKSLSPIDILKFGTVNTGITFKQYDINTSILELELVANGEPVHLKGEKVYVTVKSLNKLSTQLISKYYGVSKKEKDNYKVLLRAKKSKRRDVNNIIDVYMSPLVLENSGEMIAEVMIIDLIKEERITSQSFTFNIEPSITPNRNGESVYKVVKDLDDSYITDAEDVQLLVAEVEPNFKLSFVGSKVNEILEKANNFDTNDNANKIQALQDKDRQLDSKISNLEEEDLNLKNEITLLKTFDQGAEKEIQNLKTKDKSIEAQVSQLKLKDTAIDAELDKLKNEDETIKSSTNSKFEELKRKTDATNDEIIRLKTQDTTLSESIRTNKGLIDVIGSKVTNLEGDNQRVKNRVSVLEGDMNLAKSNISSLQRNDTDISKKVKVIEQDNTSINKILEELKRDIESYKSSIEFLESKVPVWKDFKGESFKVENSFYGKSRDLFIKGKTLQNLITGGNIKMVIDKSLVEGVRIHKRFTSYNLTPGKTYVGYINITKLEGSCQYGLRIYGMLNNDSNAYFTVANSLGWHKFVWKTNNNTNEFNIIGVYMDSSDYNNGCKITCDSFMLFEQNLETDNLNLTNYFDEIKSLGEQEGNKVSIISHSKNLLKPPAVDITKKQGSINITLTKYGEFIINGNNSTTGGGRHLFINEYNYKVEKGKSYILTYERDGGTSDDPNSPILLLTNIDNYDEILVSATITTNKKSIKFEANKDMTLFCGVNVMIGKNYNNYKLKIQLEEGKDATQYEPYKGDKKDISLQKLGFDGGLRSIDYTVYDELNYMNGLAIKRINKYTFTGDEECLLVNTYGNAIRFDFALKDIKPLGKILSNNFIVGSIGTDNLECINVHGSSKCVQIQIKTDKLSSPSLEGFRNWLKKNPTTVYYELAEPIVKSLDEDINFGTLDDITYVSIENNIKSELSCQCQVSLASNKS